ncbi:MAG: glutamate--tRNA ligase, partial [Thermoplasmata archaeon]|nr:glutamate--tRNA ligase [Thermoplasmata archaeon]
EYVKRYGGNYILRLEDTNPMKILLEAYEMIPRDMNWLGTDIHEIVVQSDRFEVYQDYARRLIELGKCYVCTCPVEKWRELKMKSRACPHRERGVEEHLDEWEKMLTGHYKEGEASLMVKTDLRHPNPAIRDFVAMRIVEHSHPRIGNKYRVYPLYNFSVAVDDHLSGITHVLRGKDHLNNTYKQIYIYRYFAWKEPEFIHYGWVTIPDTLLKTSSIREGIEKGDYSGWDDPRLGTFRTLAKRGFRPEAIRRYWVEVGVKEVDINFSWKTLIAYNKGIIDPISPRYFFVADPVVMNISGVEELSGRAPIHPDRPELGIRRVHLKSIGPGGEGGIPLLISGNDAAKLEDGKTLRLKDLGNVRVEKIGDREIQAEYTGNDLSILKQGARNIHWCPVDGIETIVHMPDGTEVKGRTERDILKSTSEMVQFERFGFVRIEKKVDEKGEGVEGFFAHK